MKLRINSRILLVVLALFMPGLAAAFPQVDSVSIDKDVPVWLAEEQTLPIVSVVLTFKGAGNISDPQTKEGRAVLASSMLTRGSGDNDALAYDRALGERAIRLGVDVDADVLTVHIKCLREFLPEALALARDALAYPTFDAVELESEKLRHLSALKSAAASPDYMAHRQLSELIYHGHPYAQAALGTPDSIAALTVDDLRDYQQTFLTSGNLAIAVAGAISDDELPELLAPLVRSLPANIAGPVHAVKINAVAGGEILRKNMPIPQSVIEFALPWRTRADKDFYAAYLLQSILGGSPLNSALGADLRREDGLVYDTGSQIDLREGGAMLLGRAATRNSSVDTVIARIKALLAKLQQNGVTKQQCDDAKSYVIGGLPLQLDSTDAFASMVALMQRDNLGTDYMQKREQLFNDVTCAQINEAARQLFDPAALNFSIAGGSADNK